MATIFTNPQGGSWYDHGKSNIVPYKPKPMVPVAGAEPIEGVARNVGRTEQVVNRLRDTFGRMKMPAVTATRAAAGGAGVGLAIDAASNLPALTAPDVGLGTKAKLAGSMALRAGGAALGTTTGMAAGTAVAPGPGTVVGGLAGGAAGYYAGDQAAGGFRALANNVNGALGGDPNYFTSVEEDLAKVGRDANGSKLANVPTTTAPVQLRDSGEQPAGVPTSPPPQPDVAGKVNTLRDSNGRMTFTDAPNQAAMDARNTPYGLTQSAEEQAKTAGINSRADQINKEIHAMKMAETHGGNAADYMPGGSRDGGDGQKASDATRALRDQMQNAGTYNHRSNSVIPDNEARGRAAALLGVDAKAASDRYAADSQSGATLRAAMAKNTMSPLEQQKMIAEINDKRAGTAKTLAETSGMPAKQKFEQDKALSSDAQTTQAQAAKNRTDYAARMKDNFGGDAEEAGRFVNAVDQTYAGLVRHLANPSKPESAKVLQRAGIDPSKAADLYASLKDGNGNLLDAYAPGNSLMPFIENGVNRAKKIGKDSWLWKNSERANAFDPYYFDEDATEVAKGGLRGTFGLRSSADDLYGLK